MYFCLLGFLSFQVIFSVISSCITTCSDNVFYSATFLGSDCSFILYNSCTGQCCYMYSTAFEKKAPISFVGFRYSFTKYILFIMFFSSFCVFELSE